MTVVWAVTLLVGADEARVLTHFGNSAPQPGPAAPHQGSAGGARHHLQLRTCSSLAIRPRTSSPGNPTSSCCRMPIRTKSANSPMALYGDHAEYRTRETNGIVTRWKIQRDVPNATRRDQQATIILPDGTAVEVVNVHLTTAATDLRLWQRSTWRDHRINRALRLDELAIVQQALAQSRAFPNTPVLFGGDFNSPASDVVHRQLTRDWVDAFAAAGTGWGDTYHRRLPILRIDLLYASRHFTPVRCHTITTRHSDHRMVVADFVMK